MASESQRTLAPHEAALAKYVADLQRYFTAEAPAGTDEYLALRRRYMHAQLAASELLKALGETGLSDEMYRLALALNDLDTGVVHPVVAPNVRGGGRVPDPSDVWVNRTRVAFAIECLRRAGRPDNVICKRLKKYPGLQSLLRPGTELETAAFGWLDQLKKQTVNNPLAIAAWDGHRDILDRVVLSPPDYESLADKSLVSVSDRYTKAAA